MYKVEFEIYHSNISKKFFCVISSDFFRYNASSYHRETKDAVLRDINKFIKETLVNQSAFCITDYTEKE